MIDDVLTLMKAMAAHGVDSLEWTRGDETLRLHRPVGGEHCAVPAPASAETSTDDTMDGFDWSEIIESPVVGTYYAQASPTDDPFVELGTKVQKGQTICIVEAMKLLNEVVAPHDGVVSEIYAKDGQKVEYGQMLMRITPKEGAES